MDQRYVKPLENARQILETEGKWILGHLGAVCDETQNLNHTDSKIFFGTKISEAGSGTFFGTKFFRYHQKK